MSYLLPASATDYTPVPEKLEVPWWVGLSNTSSSTIGQKPSPVSTLNVSLSGSTVQLSWTAATGATGYVVQSRANTESKLQTQGVTNGLTYAVSGLDPTMVYWFRVTSFNKSGYSFHIEASTVPPPLPSVNVPPSNVKIMMFAGQSNMQGQGEPYSASIDTGHPNVIQYSIGDQYSQNKSRAGTFVSAAEPMDDGGNELGAVIGPCLSFARSFVAANPTDTLILVQLAVSSSAFSNGSLNWTVGSGNLYQRALSVMNTVSAAYPTAELIGIGWCQGESDVGLGASTYRTRLLELFNAFRSSFPKASASTPISIISMVPEWVSENSSRQEIQSVHQLIPNILPYTSFNIGATGSRSSNNIHYNAAGQRINGTILFNALSAARANERPVPTGLRLVSNTSSSITVSFEGAGSSFTVVYKLASGGSEQTINTSNKTVTLSGLSAGTAYSIQVRAGSSALSNAINASTAVPTEPPSNLTSPTLSLRSSTLGSSGTPVTSMSDSGFTFNSMGSAPLVGQVGSIKTISFTPTTSLYNSTLTFGSKCTWMIMFNLPKDIESGHNCLLCTRQTATFMAMNTGEGNTEAGKRLQLFNDQIVTPTTVVPSANKWYVIFGVWDGTTNSSIIYLNGSVIGTGPCANNISGNTALCVNGLTNGSSNPSITFTYDMAEVGIWRDVALTPSEVTSRTTQLATQYGVTLN